MSVSLILASVISLYEHCSRYAIAWRILPLAIFETAPRQARMLSVDYGREPRDYQAGPIRITMKFEIPDYAFLKSQWYTLSKASKNCRRILFALSPATHEEKKEGFAVGNSCFITVGIPLSSTR